MKKFYLFLVFALLGFLGVSAQIDVKYEGNPVNDGDVLTFMAEEDDWGGVEAGSMGPSFIALEDCELEVKISIPDGALASWCISGSCNAYTGPKDITYTTDIKELKMVSQGLHIMFDKGQYADYVVPVEVRANGNLVISFFQRFIYADPAGIDNATANDASAVKFDGKQLVYNFAASATRSLQVYALDGRVVKTAALNAKSGNLSLEGLQRGAYVYSLVQAGKKVQSGKVVLK